MEPVDLSLPGQELVNEGLSDLAAGRISDAALLVLIAAPRLRGLGIQVPDGHFSSPCEHLLYARLEERLGTAAHSYYNSLLRRVVSFARAVEQERSRLQQPSSIGQAGGYHGYGADGGDLPGAPRN